MKLLKYAILVFAVVLVSCGNLPASMNLFAPTLTPTQTVECERDIATWKQNLAPIMGDLYIYQEISDAGERVRFYTYEHNILAQVYPLDEGLGALGACHEARLNRIQVLMEQSIYQHYEAARAMEHIETTQTGDRKIAEQYEQEGDRLFAEVSDLMLDYLVAIRDPYTVKQIFGKTAEEVRFSQNASLTATVEAAAYQSQFEPTKIATWTVVPVKIESGCKSEVEAFVGQVEQMVMVSHTLTTNMSQYADYGLESNFAKADIEQAFTGLSDIPVPICADQPTEIVYNLVLIRDTMLPAYIEMAMGGGTDASRADVRRWRDEVEGLLSDVDRLMGQIE